MCDPLRNKKSIENIFGTVKNYASTALSDNFCSDASNILGTGGNSSILRNNNSTT